MDENNKEVIELYKALLKVKSKMTSVKKDLDNPYFKSKYADLNTHLQMIEPLLIENGLLLLQPVKTDPSSGTNYVASIIVHTATGAQVDSIMSIVGDKDMQKLGSGVTYARRYTLASLLGVQAEDDDANSIVGNSKINTKKVTKKTKPKSGFGR